MPCASTSAWGVRRRIGCRRQTSSPAASPAFRAKTGRTVVLALTNRAEIATVFHLHGHHFRLLDRLDDGWKPFWLDTLAIDAGQTQRIVFAAEKSGRWLVGSDRDRLGGAAPYQVVHGRIRKSYERKPPPRICSVTARAVDVPISRPVKNAFGVIRSAPLVLIDVTTDQGITGRSYIFGYAKLTLKPLVALIGEIGADLTGKPIAPFDLMAAMDAKFRLLGWQGLIGMAVSGLDMAFWDVLGRAAGQPMATLLGGSPRPIRAYDSYGAVDPIADENDLRRSLERGVRGIKIKGGDGDLANDERVVKAVRALIGPDIALMLDFNQSLDPAEASRRIDRLAAYDLHWVEEPVAAENLQGHALVRTTSPISINPARTGGFRAVLPKRFRQARVTSSCPI